MNNITFYIRNNNKEIPNFFLFNSLIISPEYKTTLNYLMDISFILSRNYISQSYGKYEQTKNRFDYIKILTSDDKVSIDFIKFIKDILQKIIPNINTNTEIATIFYYLIIIEIIIKFCISTKGIFKFTFDDVIKIFNKYNRHKYSDNLHTLILNIRLALQNDNMNLTQKQTLKTNILKLEQELFKMFFNPMFARNGDNKLPISGNSNVDAYNRLDRPISSNNKYNHLKLRNVTSQNRNATYSRLNNVKT